MERSRQVIQFTFQLGCNHISGITEARIVKFLTQVGYIKCYQKDDISPLNGRGYGHVTVFKFCRLPWCSESRGFVSDRWYLRNLTLSCCTMQFALERTILGEKKSFFSGTAQPPPNTLSPQSLDPPKPFQRFTLVRSATAPSYSMVLIIISINKT